MLRKRKNFIMNDRVSKNMGGVCMSGYAFVNASINLHFGDGHKHNKLMRGVCVDGVGVVGVPGRTLVFGLCCNKGNHNRSPGRSRGGTRAAVPPMARRAPVFHGVFVGSMAYGKTNETIFFGNLPRVEVGGVGVRGVVMSGTGRNMMLDRTSRIGVGGVGVRLLGDKGGLGVRGISGMAVSKGGRTRVKTRKRRLGFWFLRPLIRFSAWFVGVMGRKLRKWAQFSCWRYMVHVVHTWGGGLCVVVGGRSVVILALLTKYFAGSFTRGNRGALAMRIDGR